MDTLLQAVYTSWYSTLDSYRTLLAMLILLILSMLSLVDTLRLTPLIVLLSMNVLSLMSLLPLLFVLSMVSVLSLLFLSIDLSLAYLIVRMRVRILSMLLSVKISIMIPYNCKKEITYYFIPLNDETASVSKVYLDSLVDRSAEFLVQPPQFVSHRLLYHFDAGAVGNPRYQLLDIGLLDKFDIVPELPVHRVHLAVLVEKSQLIAELGNHDQVDLWEEPA